MARASSGFLGTHSPKLDDKGRLFFPAKWRPLVADGLVLTVGKEACVYVYAPDTFQREGDEVLDAVGRTTKEGRDFERSFFGRAVDDDVDSQGRLVIPPHLRAYAGLDREVVLVGVRSRVEIWDAAAHDRYFSALDVTYASQS